MNAPVQQAAIRQYAKQLQLRTIGGQFAEVAEQAIRQKQSHLSYLEALLGAEVEERDRNAVARRIKEAHFPKVKTLEEFAFTAAPHIPASLVRNLAEGGYLSRSEPIIFLGETGTGKTHLATDWRWRPAVRESRCVSVRRRNWSTNSAKLRIRAN